MAVDVSETLATGLLTTGLPATGILAANSLMVPRLFSRPARWRFPASRKGGIERSTDGATP